MDDRFMSIFTVAPKIKVLESNEIETVAEVDMSKIEILIVAKEETLSSPIEEETLKRLDIQYKQRKWN